MNIYIKFLLDSAANASGEGDDVLRGRIAGIDYHQGLPLIDLGTALASPLHAGLLYEPCGRNL